MDRCLQNLVLSGDVLVTTKRYVRTSLSRLRVSPRRVGVEGGKITYEVLAGLSRHFHSIHIRKGVEQLRSVGFVSSFNGMPTLRNFTLPRRDPLHIGGDGQEIVSPAVFALSTTVCNATWRANGRNDLARMDRIVEDRGTQENRARAVCVCGNGRSYLIRRREPGVRS